MYHRVSKRLLKYQDKPIRQAVAQDGISRKKEPNLYLYLFPMQVRKYSDWFHADNGQTSL